MVKVLGVDPGVRGGLAIVSAGNGDDGAAAAPAIIDAIDIPVAGAGAKERVDVLAIRDWIANHGPGLIALIERAQAMPGRVRVPASSMAGRSAPSRRPSRSAAFR
jgi:hypothetical protein